MNVSEVRAQLIAANTARVAAYTAAIENGTASAYVVTCVGGGNTLGKPARANGRIAFEFAINPTTYTQAAAESMAKRWNAHVNETDMQVFAETLAEYMQREIARMEEFNAAWAANAAATATEA